MKKFIPIILFVISIAISYGIWNLFSTSVLTRQPEKIWLQPVDFTPEYANLDSVLMQLVESDVISPVTNSNRLYFVKIDEQTHYLNDTMLKVRILYPSDFYPSDTSLCEIIPKRTTSRDHKNTIIRFKELKDSATNVINISIYWLEKEFFGKSEYYGYITLGNNTFIIEECNVGLRLLPPGNKWKSFNSVKDAYTIFKSDVYRAWDFKLEGDSLSAVNTPVMKKFNAWEYKSYTDSCFHELMLQVDTMYFDDSFLEYITQ